MIVLRDDKRVDLAALAELRARCAFKPQATLDQQIEGSRWVIHAYDGDRLIGFARAISDGVSTAYLSSVMVDPDYRRRGIGRLMVERLIAGRPLKFVLHARHDATAFYTALGFGEATHVYLKDQRP